MVVAGMRVSNVPMPTLITSKLAMCVAYAFLTCLGGHVAWQSMLLAWKAKPWLTTLCDGSVWARLKELATTTFAQRGMGLFKDCARACKRLCGKRPAPIIVTKPNAHHNPPKLRAGKEHLLHELADKCVCQRTLSADTKAAVLIIGNIRARINIMIRQLIMATCRCLLYYNQKHQTVASNTAWEEFLQKGVSDILDLSLQPLVRQRFGWSEERAPNLEAHTKNRGCTWQPRV